jgi:hypothetical protein
MFYLSKKLERVKKKLEQGKMMKQDEKLEQSSHVRVNAFGRTLTSLAPTSTPLFCDNTRKPR